jgi:hypothetical protein
MTDGAGFLRSYTGSGPRDCEDMRAIHSTTSNITVRFVGSELPHCETFCNQVVKHMCAQLDLLALLVRCRDSNAMGSTQVVLNNP